MPTMTHAGIYSAVTHYFKAVQAAGTDDASQVAARMRQMPVNDLMARNGVAREHGPVVRDMLLVQVKTPKQSKAAWDYDRVLATIPGSNAFRLLAESDCPLISRRTEPNP